MEGSVPSAWLDSPGPATRAGRQQAAAGSAGSAPKALECLSTQQVKSLQTLGGAAVSHEANSCPPLVQACHRCLSQGEELGIDEGKHGLTTPVTVPQGAVQQLQETSG